MSNRPGLGEGFAWELASTILEHDIPAVPRAILHGKTAWPLGRYIREKAAKYSQRPVAAAEVAEEVTQLFEKVQQDPSVRRGQRLERLRQALMESVRHRVDRVEMQEQRKERRREAKQI